MKYQLLLDRIHEIHDLRKATRVLLWDREVNMPQGGDQERTYQIATLRKLSHALYTSDSTGELIEEAASELNGAPYLSKEASLIRFLRRDFALASRQSADFVSRQATLNSQATAAWKQARANDDFALFLPWLVEIVTMAREAADQFGYEGEPYDALINQFEPGTKTAAMRAMFDEAKEALIPLYQAIGRHRNVVDDQVLRQEFNVARQKEFCHYLAAAIGYDFNRGHLATAVHPFSTSLSRNDVRITTRFDPNLISTALFATLHEAGHAIYVQNVHPELVRTPLAKETSAALDESQSRLLENMIGRSRGFWRWHLQKLKQLFPAQLKDVTIDQFYRAVNKVQPNFIRVEADELTYNMHVILRFELEQELLSGQLPASDLPRAWNEKMRTFLGITPPNNTLGCLQDIHWALVGFGHFPTYALGNLYAAQFYEAALNQMPVIADELEKGQTSTLICWLVDNIHQYGRKLDPAEIVLQATGKPLDHQAFVRYVTAKYSHLYGL